VDTLKLLFDTRHFGESRFELDSLPGWKCGSMPAIGVTWTEGHPADGHLASADEVATAATRARAVVDEHFGVVKDRGVSRSDVTTNHPFHRPVDARAFLAGMAAIDLPRSHTTRRGHPVQSVSYSHATGKRILARCYDKGLERGGEPWQTARLEDQRRYPSGGRPPIEVVADGKFLRGRFEARFGPIRKAVDGVKAASFPVIAQALADEARYGYRTAREVERLAGSLVILSGGGGDAYSRRTMYRRRGELRDAGYVIADDLYETVEVNLGDVVTQALEATW